MQINHGFLCNAPKTYFHGLSLAVKCSHKQFVYCNDQNSTDTYLVLLNSPENLTNFNMMLCFMIKSKILIISETNDYSIDEIQFPNKLNDKHSLLLFQINACSHSKNIEDIELLLDSILICFDVIAITETRNIRNIFPVNDINLTN